MIFVSNGLLPAPLEDNNQIQLWRGLGFAIRKLFSIFFSFVQSQLFLRRGFFISSSPRRGFLWTRPFFSFHFSKSSWSFTVCGRRCEP